MHTLPVYALNFEILKFSAAPETYFKSIFMFGGANSTFVGYSDHFASEPFNYISQQVVLRPEQCI